MNKSILAAATLVALALTGCSSPKQETSEQPLTFRVDPTVRTIHPTVDPIGGERKTGALAKPDGSTVELVLDEVMVHVGSKSELDAFMARWDGKVIDSFDQEDHLVRVNVSKADPANLAADLAATGHTLDGEHRAGDERVLRLLAMAASEWKLGTELVLDWLTESETIETGEAFEATDNLGNGSSANVFEWPWMRYGGALDIGVGPAWQLLQAKGKLKPQVKYMVVDAGFTSNADFPGNVKIRFGEWAKQNPTGCTKGASCPWHGSDVTMAGMAKVDNKFGTAGPAGPVVSHLIAVNKGLDYWTQVRRAEEAAEQEQPDVVNLSFGRDVNFGIPHARKWTDRRMERIRKTGVLIVASAGNYGTTVDSGTLWVPCESAHVMCVGGMNNNATVSGGSNFGEKDIPTSVEIYGPMCVRTLTDPAKSNLETTTREVCGTSVASPFVGGVAALVKAANPALTSEQIRQLLNETAHVGGLGAKVTGSQRRINALAAVAKALGVPFGPPKVTIVTPLHNSEHQAGQWVDLKGTATDFMGRPLKLTWGSNSQGKLGEGNITQATKMSVGTHVITAYTQDSLGQKGEAKVTIKVVDAPPTVKIVSPVNGLKVLEGSNIPLVASSLDPETWSPIPDADTKWEVRRNGSLIHSNVGHQGMLPAAKVTPGSYTAKFTAAGITKETSFTVTEIPRGKTKPSAYITKPSSALTLSTTNGTVNVSFAGAGTDAEDGTLSGTRFRWTAYAGTQKKSLCVGSAVPGSGNGGIGVLKNCSTFTGQLGLAPGDLSSTTWTIWLEVFDKTGLVGIDTVNVTVNYVVG